MKRASGGMLAGGFVPRPVNFPAKPQSATMPLPSFYANIPIRLLVEVLPGQQPACPRAILQPANIARWNLSDAGGQCI